MTNEFTAVYRDRDVATVLMVYEIVCQSNQKMLDFWSNKLFVSFHFAISFELRNHFFEICGLFWWKW